MSANVRKLDRGVKVALDTITQVGAEFRTTRLTLGLSQAIVAAAAAIDRSRYSRVERGKTDTLTVLELCRIAAVLGLDPFVKVYPGGRPLRDGAHAERMSRFLARVRRPLTDRLEIPLPAVEGHREQRAWDANLVGGGRRTAIELEMRLYDAQTQERRTSLKRRDDPTNHFLLLVADTRTNRRILREQPELFRDLPRLVPSKVYAALQAGEHPGTGLLFV